MKRSTSSRRVTAYVQGRHHKKPVHICVSEKRERMYVSAIDVGDEREDQYAGKREKGRERKKRRVIHIHSSEEEE